MKCKFNLCVAALGQGAPAEVSACFKGRPWGLASSCQCPLWPRVIFNNQQVLGAQLYVRFDLLLAGHQSRPAARLSAATDCTQPQQSGVGSSWLATMPPVSVPTISLELFDIDDTAKQVPESWQHGILHSSTEVHAYLSMHDAQNVLRNA